MSGRSGQVATCAAAVLLGASMALAGGGGESTVQLRTGVVDTRARPDTGLMSLRALSNRGCEVSRATRALIRLDAPMNRQTKADLQEAGVEVVGFAGGDHFVVSLANASIDACRGLASVEWASDFRPEWKLDPSLDGREFRTQERRAQERTGRSPIIITLFPGASAESVRAALNGLGTIHYETEVARSTEVSATVPRRLFMRIAELPEVQHIEPRPELSDRSNLESNWVVQSGLPGITPLHDAGLTGGNQIVGVLDSSLPGLRTDHCAFSDTEPIGPTHRKIFSYQGTPGSRQHPTHVSGTIAGYRADMFVNDTRGIAYDARIAYGPYPSFDETSVFDALQLHHDLGARIHTNSWGDDSVFWYTSMCRGIDAFCYQNEESFVAFASTNQSLLRTPENSKNLVAVGASGFPNDGIDENEICSGGEGPTNDGRMKPELFAPGCGVVSANANDFQNGCGVIGFTGTSMACPAISGAATLVRQYYVDGFYPSGVAAPMDAFPPTGALLKATLLNAGVDMTGVAGYPSFEEGWGRLLTDRALFFPGDSRKSVIHDQWNATGLSTDETFAMSVSNASPGEDLRITLVWTDPPAMVGTLEVLVNDLDLEVIGPGGEIYRGNNIIAGDTTPGGVPDRINNVEQVMIQVPDVGDYIIRVKAHAINVETQGFAIVASGDVTQSLDPLSIGGESLPELIEPGMATEVKAWIDTGSDALLPGSVTLWSRIAGEPGFQSLPMQDLGGGEYRGVLAPLACGETVEYYVSAEGAVSGVLTDPVDAPLGVFSTSAGEETPLFQYDFESPQGWTVGDVGDNAIAGIWERVDPVGATVQPEDDHTPTGTMAWITGQHTPGAGSTTSDVDGSGSNAGITTVVSPVWDLSGAVSPRISMWLWFLTTDTSLVDTMRVELSNDGGSNYTLAFEIGSSSLDGAQGGWRERVIDVQQLLPVTDQMRMRVRVEDAPFNTVVEGGLDDVTITDRFCLTPAPCVGDANGDFMIDFGDLTSVLENWGAVYTPGEGGAGDADLNGVVEFADITSVLNLWLTVCP